MSFWRWEFLTSWKLQSCTHSAKQHRILGDPPQGIQWAGNASNPILGTCASGRSVAPKSIASCVHLPSKQASHLRSRESHREIGEYPIQLDPRHIEAKKETTHPDTSHMVKTNANACCICCNSQSNATAGPAGNALWIKCIVSWSFFSKQSAKTIHVRNCSTFDDNLWWHHLSTKKCV